MQRDVLIGSYRLCVLNSSNIALPIVTLQIVKMADDLLCNKSEVTWNLLINFIATMRSCCMARSLRVIRNLSVVVVVGNFTANLTPHFLMHDFKLRNWICKVTFNNNIFLFIRMPAYSLIHNILKDS